MNPTKIIALIALSIPLAAVCADKPARATHVQKWEYAVYNIDLQTEKDHSGEGAHEVSWQVCGGDGVAGRNPATFLSAAGVILVVTVLACLPSLFRLKRINPADCLRSL